MYRMCDEAPHLVLHSGAGMHGADQPPCHYLMPSQSCAAFGGMCCRMLHPEVGSLGCFSCVWSLMSCDVLCGDVTAMLNAPLLMFGVIFVIRGKFQFLC